jgi:Fe-S-cluster containining protein
MRPADFCIACGDCCRWYKLIRLTDEDISRLADHLGITESQFRTLYAQENTLENILSEATGLDESGRKALFEILKEDGLYGPGLKTIDGKGCIFLTEEGLCSVHEARPSVCRQWPHTISLARQEGCPIGYMKPADFCVGCGACCKGVGVVSVTDDDLGRLAMGLKRSIRGILKDYVSITPKYGAILRQKPGTLDCIFLKNGKCSVHNFKPEQCAESPKSFEEAKRDGCPIGELE